MAQVVHKVSADTVRARIGATPEEIAVFCRAHHIRWLALFGSVLRDDFRDESDIDVLVEFDLGYKADFSQLLAMKDELSASMGGREVDFIVAKNLKWRIRDRVFAEAETLYGTEPPDVVTARLGVSPRYEMAKDESLYIGDMYDTARRIERIVAGRTRADYDTDELFQLSVLHLVQTIGEAATRVSRPTRDTHPDIPWGKIIGMRNILVHRYDAVDDDIIWETVTVKLAPLIAELEQMLPPEMRSEP